jgi:formylglycine-generating enzyme required for sulfatase activity
MRLRLEKCPICESTPPSSGETCGVCRSPFIFIEYFLDLFGREQHKKQLDEYRKRWKGLNEYLKTLLELHEEKWSNNAHWSDIWRQIKPYAASLNFEEPEIIRLAQSVSRQFESDHNQSAAFQAAQSVGAQAASDSPKTPADKVRQKIAAWVSRLPGAEYSVADWVNFTDSLGVGDGRVGNSGSESFSFDKLSETRDEEIVNQFISFETVLVNAAGEFYNRRLESARRFIETPDGNVEIVMIKISGGSFEMGADGWSHTVPRHTVNVPEFYIGALPVTQLQWNAVARLPKINLELEANPSHFRGDYLPVDSVSWLEAVEFCARLSKRTGRKYRLPSEAEWEYAACAGAAAGTAFAFGEILTPALANYEEETATGVASPVEIRNGVIPAGILMANAFGLYDMHGNVWEWCADAWHKNYSGAPEDGRAWTKGSDSGRRVLRGGAWCNWADLCRSSERIAEREDKEGKLNYIGFRLALDL